MFQNWKAKPEGGLEPRRRWPTRRDNDTLADLARTLGRQVDPTQSEVVRVVTAFNTAWKAIPELKAEINQYAAALDNERRAKQMAEQAARVAEKQLAKAEDRFQELLAKHTRVMTTLGASVAALADAKRAGDDYDPPPAPPPARPGYAEHPQREETLPAVERAVMGERMGPQHDTVMEDIGNTVRRMVGREADANQQYSDDIEERLKAALRPPEPAPQPETDPLVLNDELRERAVEKQTE